MKFQYIRQSSGQEVGNQVEIVPLTESVFQEEIRPRLRAGYADSLEEWQALHPEVTHYRRVRSPKAQYLRGWEFQGAGPAAMLVPALHDDRWIEVMAWDSPEARRWGRLTKVPRKQDWSPRSR